MIGTLFETLERRRDRIAIRGLDTESRPAWEQTGEQLLLLAGGWQERLTAEGVEPGERVGIDVRRGPDLLAVHLATLALGACAVPLNPALRPAERDRVLARADLRTCVTGEGPSPTRASPRIRPSADPHSPALLIFTSGTTGDPKGVPHTLAALEANLEGLAAMWELQADEPLLHVLPAHHVHGLVLGLYGGARAGMPLILAPRFTPEACLAALETQRIGVLMGVPTMYHRLAKVPALPQLPGLRLLISGSAPLAPEDFRACQERFGHAPVERYGLTETLIVSSNPLDARRPGTVGRPLPDTEIRLASDGEILVRGPAVTRGYWRNAEATAEATRDGFFCTGDLGRLDPAGHLVIAGRKKELILVGGSNVLPGEVERALSGVSGVEELAAVGLPDRDRGEVVAACVVLTNDAEPRDAERALRAAAEDLLAPYKRPTLYRFLETLPRNSMGKLDRRSLRQQVTS